MDRLVVFPNSLAGLLLFLISLYRLWWHLSYRCMSIFWIFGRGEGIFRVNLPAICPHGSYLSQAWYTQNLQISIPVTVVVGIIVLVVLSCIARCMFLYLLWYCLINPHPKR